MVQVLCGFAELLLRRRQLITFDVHLLLILFYEVVGAQRVCVRIQEQLCRLLLDLSLGLVDPLNVGKEFGSVQACQISVSKAKNLPARVRVLPSTLRPFITRLWSGDRTQAGSYLIWWPTRI